MIRIVHYYLKLLNVWKWNSRTFRDLHELDVSPVVILLGNTLLTYLASWLVAAIAGIVSGIPATSSSYLLNSIAGLPAFYFGFLGWAYAGSSVLQLWISTMIARSSRLQPDPRSTFHLALVVAPSGAVVFYTLAAALVSIVFLPFTGFPNTSWMLSLLAPLAICAVFIGRFLQINHSPAEAVHKRAFEGGYRQFVNSTASLLRLRVGSSIDSQASSSTSGFARVDSFERYAFWTAAFLGSLVPLSLLSSNVERSLAYTAPYFLFKSFILHLTNGSPTYNTIYFLFASFSTVLTLSYAVTVVGPSMTASLFRQVGRLFDLKCDYAFSKRILTQWATVSGWPILFLYIFSGISAWVPFLALGNLLIQAVGVVVTVTMLKIAYRLKNTGQACLFLVGTSAVVFTTLALLYLAFRLF